jgi:excinuclease ABC subunit C
MIPSFIKLKNNELPDEPGVYFYYDANDNLLYVGKATSLRKRVGSYFTKAHDNRIAELVRQIARVDYIQVPTVIEALVLEANKIKAYKPKYNILARDDKSFLYLTITNEKYPRPLLMRGLDLERLGIDPFKKYPPPARGGVRGGGRERPKFLAVFGPYTSGLSLRRALDYVRRIIPWSDCQPPEVTGRRKACFNVHLKKCPGVCTGAISPKAYRRIIRHLILFFEGKTGQLLRHLKKEMKEAAARHEFELAARLRDNIYALEHIQDVAFIMKEDVELPFTKTEEFYIDLNGRIEAYDISNISGTSAVGSMVVFQEGKPAKSEYRKFRIRSVKGANDVAMLEEVMRRRLRKSQTHPNSWPLPAVMVIDGGEGQVNRVQRVLNEVGEDVPLIGIAKGFDRKQDRLVYDRENVELARVAMAGKELFQRARDEAHRFAVRYHRTLRGRRSLGSS